MSGGPVFAEGERDRILASHEAARAAAEACGLAMPARGEIHARFNRWLIRRLRRGAGRRPRHAEAAAILLSWSRGQGRPDLFALAPFALALDGDHGRAGVEAVAARLPEVAEALSRLDAIAVP